MPYSNAPPARDRLIVALDLPNAVEGEALATRLGSLVSFYKIGLGMLTGGGLALALALKDEGKRVFLDLKLYDIGATVEAAVRGLAQFDLDYLTVHGDPHVVEAAIRGRGRAPMRILAVSVLTSLDREDLDRMMLVEGSVNDVAVERARRALLAGADGVIASTDEVAAIRNLPEAQERLIVTPGIRPSGDASHDQKRTGSPADAISAGADHIVVGRPIWAAADPRAAAEAVLAEIAA
ncbi:MAG: orotidine-5'-phosphate decarboxylase [Paracoccaceae bacterium]